MKTEITKQKPSFTPVEVKILLESQAEVEHFRSILILAGIHAVGTNVKKMSGDLQFELGIRA